MITVDDPVEYQLPGSNQVAANEAIGMTFATTLRSLLRQANIILVGKISDRETAEIAVRIGESVGCGQSQPTMASR